jgi:cytidine deaminase
MIRRIEHTFCLEEWKAQDLSAEDQALLQAAYEACESAYSPYSKFNVGSAVQLEDGTLIKGSNQENAAYPSGLCAERVASSQRVLSMPARASIAAAVVTDSSMPVEDFSPCGGCRQVMLESEERQNENIRFLMQTGRESHVLVSDSVAQFLPLSFQTTALSATLRCIWP